MIAPSMASQPAAPLEDTDWKLVEAGRVTVPGGLPEQREPRLRFDASSKRASGFTAVNNFNGSYQTSAGALGFGAIAATGRAGPPPAMEIESALLKALEATRAYRISADELELLDDGGNRLARFSAKSAP